MNIESLVGFTLDRCSFSKGSYSFEFCGSLNGDFKRFNAGTAFNFSVNEDGMIDSGENFSKEVWPFLEKNIKAISVEEEHEHSPRVVFSFEDDTRFIIWWPRPLMDNLLIVTETKTGEWFTVG